MAVMLRGGRACMCGLTHKSEYTLVASCCQLAALKDRCNSEMQKGLAPQVRIPITRRSPGLTERPRPATLVDVVLTRDLHPFAYKTGRGSPRLTRMSITTNLPYEIAALTSVDHRDSDSEVLHTLSGNGADSSDLSTARRMVPTSTLYSFNASVKSRLPFFTRCM
jgi:hypothetical protein